MKRLSHAVERHAISMLAWVVMPEHVHFVVYSDDAQSITRFLQALKMSFAREVLLRWRELNAPILFRLRNQKGEAHFWQVGGGYDRNLVGDELVEKIRYIHKNPITRGLVSNSTLWRWSSAAAYCSLPNAIGPQISFELIPPHRGELT